MRSPPAEWMLAGLLLASLSACGRGTAPVAAEAWIRSAPPGVGMNAGYLTLENPTQRDYVLVGVASPAFARAEIHQTRLVDGIAQMRQLDRLELPAGERVMFEPGGLHLMLIDPQAPLADGERVALELQFEDGSRIEVEAEVGADRSE